MSEIDNKSIQVMLHFNSLSTGYFCISLQNQVFELGFRCTIRVSNNLIQDHARLGPDVDTKCLQFAIKRRHKYNRD